MLIAKTGGGLKTKKRKKAFTLIELLAIIVILAIIAVITVPIILNIIDNSKKGAAIDSAYGYKDAVNKWYVQELAKPNNQNLKLDKTYTVESDGKLTGKFEGDESQTKSVTIDVSGTVPTGGSLTYSNNVLTSGTLIIGDYTATYSNGSFTAVKTSASSTEVGNGGSETPTNPYLTRFDGTYGYDWPGVEELISNGGTNEWTSDLGDIGPYHRIYLRHSTEFGIETCGVFGSGQTETTVCLSPSSTGYSDNFGNHFTVLPSSRNMTQDEQNDWSCNDNGYTSNDDDGMCYFCPEEYDQFDGDSKMCYKDGEYIVTGYAKAKMDEMLAKGASSCDISEEQVECSAGFEDLGDMISCSIKNDGSVLCRDNNDGMDVNSDGSSDFHSGS